MITNTNIEWADHTFNPWWGCTKISPACDQSLDNSCANCGCNTWVESPIPVTEVFRMGKKAAGRLLDGVEHNEVPNGRE